MTEKEHHGEHGGHDDHGHGHGSPFIQHHYDDAQHQFDAGKLGIWLFLVQEVLFFSGLFVAYILYRAHHPDIFEYAHKYLAVHWGGINTGVLILSSLTAAWAVRCAQLGQKKALVACITVTIMCACGFLGIKYIEYSYKWHHGELYGRYFDPCNSPNETKLLTKTRQCPGVVESVVWAGPRESGSATAGCLEAGDYDRDPATPGIQAQCSVDEVTYQTAKRKVEVSRRELEPCEMEREPGSEEGARPKKTPCYVLQINPNVCAPDRPGVLALYGDDKLRPNVGLDPQCNKAVAVEHKDPYATSAAPIVEGAKLATPFPEASSDEKEFEFVSGPPPEHTNFYFSLYFAMTGLHGLHVMVGIIIYVWLLIRALKGHFTPDYFGPIDYAALYWHLVDLIWIFLFPLFYLIH